MILIIVILILVVVYYYAVIVKNGSLSFWKLASKNPDFVYEQLLKDSAWVIDEKNSKTNKDKFDGPFLLYVPKIGKTVKFYGEVGKYEESQKKIEIELTKIE